MNPQSKLPHPNSGLGEFNADERSAMAGYAPRYRAPVSTNFALALNQFGERVQATVNAHLFRLMLETDDETKRHHILNMQEGMLASTRQLLLEAGKAASEETDSQRPFPFLLPTTWQQVKAAFTADHIAEQLRGHIRRTEGDEAMINAEAFIQNVAELAADTVEKLASERTTKPNTSHGRG